MTKFGEQFKKELEDIKTDPFLLDRTLERIRAKCERDNASPAARKEADSPPVSVTRKGPRRDRVVFFRTAVALAAVALVATGAILFASYFMRSEKAEKKANQLLSPEAMDALPDTTVFDEICGTKASEEAQIVEGNDYTSRDPDLVPLEDYETLLAQMRIKNYLKPIDETETQKLTDDTEGSSRGYSETNIQTRGVDEADIVKSDDSTLYYVNSNRLKIFDIQDPADLRLDSDIVLSYGENGRVGIGLHYDPVSGKLWVISQSQSYRGNLYETPGVDPEKNEHALYISTDTVTVETYDVHDPSDPVLLSSFSQDGTYRSSRRIGQTVYLVTEKPTWGHQYDTPEVFPAVKTDGGQWATIPARDIFVVGSGYIGSFTVVTALGDPLEGGETISLAVASAGGTVYASPDMLFVAGTTSDYTEYDSFYEAEPTFSTKILSFSIADGGLTAFGAGSVPGRIIDQYSMDHRGGYLRIVTTDYDVQTDRNMTNVFVLDDRLDIYSSLGGLSSDEKLYSVRFEEDRIYLVTFDQFDPLLVIDATEPGDLTVIGKLSVPGFSNYLHPAGDDLLLGIGQIRRESESDAPAGLKLTLFDISDPDLPVERSTLVYGINWGASEAEYDPRALMIGPGNDMFGLPVWFDKEPPTEPFSDDDNVEGYLLVRIDSDEKLIEEHLFLNHGYKGACRGAFTQEALFIVSQSSIVSYNIDTYESLDSLVIEYD